MTNPGLNTENWWEFDWFAPQPHQDSELLQNLGFLPGLKELLILRQVHALEHATVWILSESASTNTHDNDNLSGLSTEKGFYLYGNLKLIDLQRAVRRALNRLQSGEWQLAIHPRCGTNLSVSLLLTTAMVLGTATILPKFPLTQLLGIGLAATTANQLAPEVGSSVQRYLTTAIPFNLEVLEITQKPDMWGRSAYFVRVGWRDLQQNLNT